MNLMESGKMGGRRWALFGVVAMGCAAAFAGFEQIDGKDYWRDAWFNYNIEKKGWTDPPVCVKPALECFEDNDLGALVFSWRGMRFPYVSFRPPATMKDFADYLTVATEPI